MNNIFLIGMPGCGKSTVGRILAERLNRNFVDADDFFSEETGSNPGEMIEKCGEKEFRRIETECLKKLSMLENTVIACGGGVVTVEANKDIMINSEIVYISRSLEKLAVKGRPLSQSKGVEKLYEERREKYENWSTIKVENNHSKECAEEIVRFLKFGRK